ncbi:PIG-L deacetylase family protein [Paenibacillus validus]|uniref:PIG-L deacetylase family protein n=1 Tax=Paenibacillus validus TaxID=44253 RepID=UPI003D2CC9F2
MHAFHKILVLSAHTDDIELGCGATVNKWINEGKEVHYLAFSAAEESVPYPFPKDQLRKEAFQSTAVLGINEQNIQVLKYPVRRFSEYRQHILDDMVKTKTQIQPDLIILPCLKDVHQDHQVVSMEGIRAFKNHSILAYELPWNLYSFKNMCYSLVDDVHMDHKYKALQCYKTQENRPYFNKDFIYGLAKMRGVQVNYAYAECFEMVRWII